MSYVPPPRLVVKVCGAETWDRTLIFHSNVSQYESCVSQNDRTGILTSVFEWSTGHLAAIFAWTPDFKIWSVLRGARIASNHSMDPNIPKLSSGHPLGHFFTPRCHAKSPATYTRSATTRNNCSIFFARAFGARRTELILGRYANNGRWRLYALGSISLSRKRCNELYFHTNFWDENTATNHIMSKLTTKFFGYLHSLK